MENYVDFSSITSPQSSRAVSPIPNGHHPHMGKTWWQNPYAVAGIGAVGLGGGLALGYYLGGGFGNKMKNKIPTPTPTPVPRPLFKPGTKYRKHF